MLGIKDSPYQRILELNEVEIYHQLVVTLYLSIMIKVFFKEGNAILSYSASLIFHMLLFAIAYFFADLHLNKVNPNAGYVQVFTNESNVDPINFEKSLNQEKDEKLENQKQENLPKKEPVENSTPAVSLNFLDQNADTTSLEQVYSEKTMNVSIKYPAGWTFLDQNVSKKLDGVTFWASNTNINPPPYVHLEVRDKNLFNESRYKHSLISRDAVLYFNDPENLANYVSQTFYFRTETDNDFIIKLTIKGEDAFKSFAPTFYGMLKSFSFDSSFF